MDLRKYLKGAEYPAQPEELQHTARQNNAPDDVIQGFSRLPLREYRSADEVTQALKTKRVV